MPARHQLNDPVPGNPIMQHGRTRLPGASTGSRIGFRGGRSTILRREERPGPVRACGDAAGIPGRTAPSPCRRSPLARRRTGTAPSTRTGRCAPHARPEGRGASVSPFPPPRVRSSVIADRVGDDAGSRIAAGTAPVRVSPARLRIRAGRKHCDGAAVHGRCARRWCDPGHGCLCRHHAILQDRDTASCPQSC